MSEKQETVHVVLRRHVTTPNSTTPVKVFDDRADARAYKTQMNNRSDNFLYTVKSCKKG